MLGLPFELLLSFRYLRPKRTFVSVITLISIVGVMLGVAVLIIVISVMSGFDRELRDRLLGFNAHLRVEGTAPFADYREIMDLIRQTPHVRGVAPYVMGPVLVETDPEDEARRAFAPYIRGIDPRLEEDVSELLSSVVHGTNEVRGSGVLVGEEFARRMRLGVGDRLAVYSIPDLQRMREAGGDVGILPDDYEVRGIFDLGYYEFNSMFIICSLADAQDLYGMGDRVQGLMVMLDDPAQAPAVRAELGPQLGPRFYLSTWQQDNAPMLEALVVEKNVMFYLLFFIMIVAAFGITSALITFAVQKTREIGMLKALGASGRQITVLFLSQSLTVGLLGVVAGFFLGILAVAYRNQFLYFMRRATGFELFPAQIYNFSELPALLVPGDIAVICGGSVAICILAGVVPAWHASRLEPVEALRHE